MTEKQETSAHLDAQLGVIGSLLLDADKCAGEVFLRTKEDQYTGEYKTLFAAAKRLYQEGRPIDPVTVRGIAGEEYTNLILQIMELTPTAANCGAYLDLLVEQAQVSKMQTLGLALASCKSAEEAKHLIEEANQVVVQRAALRVVSAEQGHLQDFIKLFFFYLSVTVAAHRVSLFCNLNEIHHGQSFLCIVYCIMKSTGSVVIFILA